MAIRKHRRLREFAWALVKDGRIVYWRSLAPDGEEGCEIHRTRALARSHRFKNERVVKVFITERP